MVKIIIVIIIIHLLYSWMSDESAEEGSDGSESIPSKRKFVGKYGRQSNNMQKKKKLCMSSDGSGEENKRYERHTHKY